LVYRFREETKIITSRETVPKFPEGFRYRPELISWAEENTLITHVRELPFRDFEFHGYTGKRRVVSFGWHYDFSARQLQKADDIPNYLLALRAVSASFASMEPEALQHVLVTEYGPSAGIGWHRDKAVFGEVVGVSLLSVRVPHEAKGKREEVGACELDRQAALRLPLERPCAIQMGAQHPADGCPAIFNYLPQRARRLKGMDV
jgi:alkylated DNA repair dioxygenase AlkB